MHNPEVPDDIDLQAYLKLEQRKPMIHDIRKISNDEDIGDALRDEDGNFYEVSDQYYQNFLEQTSAYSVKLTAARHLLESNLDILTDRQKEVMIKTLGGETLRKIADDLGIDHTTVREHLHAAKKKIKQLIEQTEGVITNGEIDID